MTTADLTSTDPAAISTDTLVLATAPDGDAVAIRGLASFRKAVRTALTDAAAALGATGKVDDVVKLPAPSGVAARLVVLTGTGAPQGEADGEALRRAAGAATRSLTGTADAALWFDLSEADDVAAVAEGALLGAYTFTGYHGSPDPVARVQIGVADAKDKAMRAALTRAVVVAEGVNGVRDLVNTAPNELYPATFADAAAALTRGTKVSIDVLDDVALREGGYGGITGVGQGSVRGPRLVKVEWSPRKPAGHYALIGKGITFDSGGLSLKPPTGMVTMKCDMAGAAVVLHTVLAAAKLRLGVKVTGWLALAENMPSGAAQRPSDVVTMRGGKTVEVLNTDAEGRLVMADALVAAGEEKPDALIDVATLTGAQMVALGAQVSAVMGTEGLREQVLAAASTSGEQFWPMPLPEELRSSLTSQVADLANIGDRFGGMLVAGLFLKEFTDGLPWAHLDIAGPAFNEGAARHYVPKGGTGTAVRTLVQLLQDVATSSA